MIDILEVLVTISFMFATISLCVLCVYSLASSGHIHKEDIRNCAFFASVAYTTTTILYLIGMWVTL